MYKNIYCTPPGCWCWGYQVQYLCQVQQQPLTCLWRQRGPLWWSWSSGACCCWPRGCRWRNRRHGSCYGNRLSWRSGCTHGYPCAGCTYPPIAPLEDGSGYRHLTGGALKGWDGCSNRGRNCCWGDGWSRFDKKSSCGRCGFGFVEWASGRKRGHWDVD